MSNQLINQTSPYLLQHANNPVNWHPWAEHALELACNQHKPILLSIGYAACHWCHVMERESFENDAIAKIMNKYFVCIKVDREERPDLDKIYQLAHQMLTQRPGGWPLTIALTPDGHAPFFAGTYFPPEPRYNMPGFGELLEKIATHFADNADKLSDYHLSFNNALEKLNPQSNTSKIPVPLTALNNASAHLAKQYDTEFGGFGDAPKFPHPTQLELLLIAASNTDSAHSGVSTKDVEAASKMVGNTLMQMAQGGLFDHLGGGFFRYSVDRKWQIPHFEKMLYDNAQLLSLYCDGYHLFGNNQYADTARSTAQWVITEMQQPGGGYASTLDADSEGEEGKYYVWHETDLRAVLTENEYSILENYFGLFGEANFEGCWHFSLNPETTCWSSDSSEIDPEMKVALSTAKSKLLDIRGQRICPDLDHKILTAWNGLMIKGMAKVGRILQRPEFIQSAQRAVDFVRNNMWRGMLSKHGRMLAACSQGKAHLNGYLDDYAFMLDGLIELLASSWRATDLEFAIAICDAMLERFEDREKGGFFFTSHDHEKLLYRPKYGADDAIPSGNGAAILGLLKLGNLLGESKYLQSAESALSLFAEDLEHHPSVNALMTIALQHIGDQHTTVIIRGDDEDNQVWQQFFTNRYRPLTSVFAIGKDAPALPPTLASRKAAKTTVAYICKGDHCTPRITSLDALKKQFS